MKKLIIASLAAMLLPAAAGAAVIKVTVDSIRYQYITGFGAAACYGLMEPIRDTSVVNQLYGPDSKVGLNILRMEISPNLIGNVTTPWDTPYDWHGYLPSVRAAKERGAIIYGVPWSPPGVYKTNGTAQGGNTEDENAQRGKLKPASYSKFFTWLNTFCAYMKDNNAAVDVVALQNEPDWWVNYSGCLYTPAEMHDLVKRYASRLLKDTYGVRLMGGESLNFTPEYTDILLNDPETEQHIDLIGGHIYGNPPLQNMKRAAATAAKYNKEAWMTEHSVNPRGEQEGIVDLPTWHEQLLFAEELNESMLAGCSAYIYWYMIAHWSFIGSGEATRQPGNDYGKLLDRALVMSHFSKHLPGATRLGSRANVSIGTNTAFEASAYIKGDSLIVQVIDTTAKSFDIEFNLPYAVKAGKRILSTEGKLCQEEVLAISEPSKRVTFDLPARSLTTYIFTIDNASTAIRNLPAADTATADAAAPLYNLNGQRVERPVRRGIYIQNGRKFWITDVLD